MLSSGQPGWSIIQDLKVHSQLSSKSELDDVFCNLFVRIRRISLLRAWMIHNSRFESRFIFSVVRHLLITTTPQLITINYAFTDSICFVIRHFSARHLLWLCIYFWLQSVWIVSEPVFQPEIASARHGLSLFSAVSSANCACWAGRLASHPASSQANLQDRSQAGYRPTCSQTRVEPARQTLRARTGSQGHPSQKAQAEKVGEDWQNAGAKEGFVWPCSQT